MLAATDKHAERPPKRLQYPSFDLHALTPHMGAEIDGLDLSQPLDEDQSRDLDAAFRDWMVLVFRDQELGRDQHKAFGRRFGELHSHPMHKVGLRGDDPEILPVVTTADSAYTAGDGWHSDVTWRLEPSLGSILRCLECPPIGGDTLFSDMYAAYDNLPEAVREKVEGKFALHDFEGFRVRMRARGASEQQITEFNKAYPNPEHPVIRTHPETGRTSLFVGPILKPI